MPQTPTLTNLVICNGENPEHGDVLLARLADAAQRIMEYDAPRGLRALRDLHRKHQQAQRHRT